jgi:sugar O-acyltransferase (sialic acid O-acetyltransferase NeuD family)
MQAQRLDREKLAILGRGLFALEAVDLAEDTGKYKVAAFIENWDREKTQQPLLDRPIIWIDEAASLTSTHKAVCALGTTHRQGFIEQAAAMGFEFATIIHPSVRLSSNSSVGEGSILSVGVIIASYTRVGRHVIINRGSLIGHHTTIHDYVTISPGANIAGSVTIGEGTYVGIGAIVLDHRTIGAHAVIGAGAVVTRDVPDRVQVMGIPAKITKENIEGI